MQDKNVLITLLNMPRPVITLSAVTQLLNIERTRFRGHYGWREREITHAQQRCLNDLGIIIPRNDKDQFGRGQAADTIDTLLSNPEQRRLLKYHLTEANGLLEIGR